MIEKRGQYMIEPNTIDKLKNFSDNRKDSGYQLEPLSGISPSVIIFGEKHTDNTERKDQKDLIKNLGLANFVLLAEDEGYFTSWKGKYGCEEVTLCDLEKGDKDKKQRELLRRYLTAQDLEKYDFAFETDHLFGICAENYPDLKLKQQFNDAREKEMGEIIRSNHSRESSKPIVVIIGHYHAREDSEVHKILEKEKIDHICIWNKKAVKEFIW
ncbi:MAG: hypothetical protein KJ882_05200 [Proteobacteria bacterium]|nr:hypothetical protein [Pseudomonadota bacterium]MDP3105262.1 hypothetical protein [Candidatus Methanoperedens sp.]